jgi:ribosomal protein S18 acetylase RimI-like enzyme
LTDDAAATDFLIRPARRDDAETLATLWSQGDLVRPWNDPAADIDGFLEADNAEIMIGESDGAPVASVAVGHDGHRGWLYYLVVHPNCRGRGYGRQLVRAAEIWLSERRIPKVQLMLRGENQAAKGFYDALGYALQPVGVYGRWLSPRGVSPESDVQPDEAGKLDVIVTYLEMTHPPADPPPHPPAGKRVALMRAEPPTVAFYRFLYDRIGRDWLWWERRALDDAALERVIAHPQVEVYVLYVDGTPAGLAELDRRHEPRIELAYLGVMPEFLGQGLGRYLLGAALDIAWSHAPDRVTVNTCTLDHPKALTLYQRFGFAPTEREERRIDDPRLTGILPAF